MSIETAAMHDVGEVFAADILHHDHCCKGYFNKYHAKIGKIMNNLEKEDSFTAGGISFKARFLTFWLDFSSSAHSVTSIRDRLNECSTEMVLNRAVKQLFIDLYESLRISPVQKVATKLAQELKVYSFQLQKSFCEPHDRELSMDMFVKNQPTRWTEFCSDMFK